MTNKTTATLPPGPDGNPGTDAGGAVDEGVGDWMDVLVAEAVAFGKLGVIVTVVLVVGVGVSVADAVALGVAVS